MKKFIAMLLAVMMIASLCACGTTQAATTATEAAPAAEAAATEAAAEPAAEESAEKVGQTVLKCAFNQTITNPEAQTLLWISDELYDATEGRYSIEVYPDATLGDQASSLETLMAGGIEMSLVANSIIENYSADFAVIGTPYVYDSLEHQEKVFESGVLADLYATTEQYGFTVLCAYSLGSRNLYLAKAPVAEGEVVGPDDVQGLKIRVMGSETCQKMWGAMSGVDGISMAQGDVYSAIQTGTLDGAENNIITYTDLVQYEVAPVYVYTGHLMIPDELTINKAFFDSMSAEDQAALLDICNRSQAYFFELAAALRDDYAAKATEMGVTFFEADVPAFQALCADLIAEKANMTDLTKAVYQSVLDLR